MTLDEVRAQLHEHARQSQEETAQIYDKLAAMARRRGDEKAVAGYEREAARQRAVPLPNAA
ncbi:hypothetical protein JIG36_42650 [Actinoplanes sp. LDG1-06]|uniref:Uncharacterized protein n=1 Tax=Paractinoplanes ovalisporus TaxID=2810368 RepID=A0ABS2AQX2_9ACTN|nr:hypothetical protein [Actinoplanes ovalisporus]MBM2622224.1 hypothetical protein [Actinoplanes ovalisporus]